MQYILTEEEYVQLIGEQERKLRLKVNKLQELCTRIANEMPITIGKSWPSWKNKPWGCILTAGDNGERDDDWYCDHCPVQEICPHPRKSYSK